MSRDKQLAEMDRVAKPVAAYLSITAEADEQRNKHSTALTESVTSSLPDSISEHFRNMSSHRHSDITSSTEDKRIPPSDVSPTAVDSETKVGPSSTGSIGPGNCLSNDPNAGPDNSVRQSSFESRSSTTPLKPAIALSTSAPLANSHWLSNDPVNQGKNPAAGPFPAPHSDIFNAVTRPAANISPPTWWLNNNAYQEGKAARDPPGVSAPAAAFPSRDDDNEVVRAFIRGRGIEAQWVERIFWFGNDLYCMSEQELVGDLMECGAGSDEALDVAREVEKARMVYLGSE